jgi:predicted MFS family arabinose efflux permease
MENNMADAQALPTHHAFNPERANWGAVYAMGLCSFALITSEFLPVSLLSPIAQDLHLTEGQAGQAIAISGVFAVVTSLFVTRLIGTIDRKLILVGLTASMIVSGMLVAFAPSYFVMMAGRAMLGCTIGGFWSMSAANAMRLVPATSVATALAIINGGNAMASTVAAPLGSFMGGLIGWRGAFFCVVPIALVATLWQAVALPRLPAHETRGDTGVLTLLRRGPVRIGMLAVGLLFAGQFALFTYLRPFLEQVTLVDLSVLSLMLLIVGLAGFAASFVIGRFADQRLEATLIILPAIMATVAVALSMFGQSIWATGALLAVWGFAGTAAPVAWWTWLSRTIPDAAEAGGGLMVAVVQLAITLGATVGGIAFDAAGPGPEFLASGGILAAAAAAAYFASRSVM